jgi:5-methylcytosine-specific restriction endonuclease McrA
MQDVLLLNADYRPVQVVSWERAVCLLLDRKARTVAEYADRFIHSENLTIAWPAVVSLVEYVRVKAGPKLNRRNVLARDGFACVYCGVAPRLRSGRPDTAALTLDHVVPRSRAIKGRVTVVGPGPAAGKRVNVTSWENLVSACEPCNHSKADRTPAEAGLVLRRPPRRPNATDTLRIALASAPVPAEWRDYLVS